jgi:SAM-dependent methyltransferase
MDRDRAVAQFDASVPNPARMYDYYLGGKDNFQADRDAADEVLAVVPEARALSVENRAFLRRAVRFLAGEAGVRQFIDLGAGLPTQGNTHEVARAVAPDTRVAYVDNDPMVVTHGRALLADDATVIVGADLREPDTVLRHPTVLRLLDLSRPVAVLLLAILHFIPDQDDPEGIVARFRDAMAPGSYLVISHASADLYPELAERVVRLYERGGSSLSPRTYQRIAGLFAGMDLVEPGLVRAAEWRPDGTAADIPEFGSGYAGVARKP